MNTDSTILVPFLNRAGEEFKTDDWFHLVPLGHFYISRKEKDGQKRHYLQVVDEIAADRIIAAFTNRRAANSDYKLLVDFEHFSHDIGKSTEAACWVTDMEKRADGVWAKGEWSDIGETAIRNRRYRYLSPVWLPNQTEKLGENRFRPVEVNDAGLTNKPNLGDALTPFWNRADEPFNGSNATNQQPQQNQNMTKTKQLLGLSDTATDDDVFNAVTALKAAAGQTDAFKNRATTLETELTGLKAEHQKLLGESVAKELEANRDVIPEGQQEAWKNRLESDFAGTAALLRGIKRPETPGKKPVHKAGAAAAAAAKNNATDEDDTGSPFLNRVQELMRDEKLTELQAIDKVAHDAPALYRDYAENLRKSLKD